MVEQLTPDKITQIYQRFFAGSNLDEAFPQRFGIEVDETALNQSHQIIVVAAELDDATDRIIGYNNACDILINALFFQVFQHGESTAKPRITH